MRVLTELIEKAHDSMEEVEWYAEKAIALRESHKELADCYHKIAEAHIDIYRCLHEQMVDLINEEKKNGTHPPIEMVAVWNYEHERLSREFREAKVLVEEYKKSY
jgi:hypothetical protein